MKKKYSPEEIIDYLNGMMSDVDKADFDLALKQDESLRMEINDLVLVRQKLTEVNKVHPPSINADTIIRNSRKDWKKTIYQSVRYAALILMTLIVIGSLSNINIRYNDEGLQLSMSIWPEQTIITENPVVEESISPTTLALLQEFQEQQAQLVADIIEKDRADQRQQIQELFSEYATMIENRRMIDMELIQYELDNIAQRTDTKQRQTDLVLGSLLESISLK